MRNPREIELLRSLLPIGSEATLAEIFERTSIQASELPFLVESLQQVWVRFQSNRTNTLNRAGAGVTRSRDDPGGASHRDNRSRRAGFSGNFLHE